eukprot:2347573-Rhodomonas_salina.2
MPYDTGCVSPRLNMIGKSSSSHLRCNRRTCEIRHVSHMIDAKSGRYTSAYSTGTLRSILHFRVEGFKHGSWGLGGLHLLPVSWRPFRLTPYIHKRLHLHAEQVLQRVLVVRGGQQLRESADQHRALLHVAHAVDWHRVAQQRVVRRQTDGAVQCPWFPREGVDGHHVLRPDAVRSDTVQRRSKRRFRWILDPRGLADRVRRNLEALWAAEQLELSDADAVEAPIRPGIGDFNSNPPTREREHAEHTRRAHHTPGRIPDSGVQFKQRKL